MSISQETANLIDTLASAASKIGSTNASSRINSLICSLVPDVEADALRQENIALQAELSSLQTSARIGAENLEILRGKLKEISMIATEALPAVELRGEVDLTDEIRKIIELSDDVGS